MKMQAQAIIEAHSVPVHVMGEAKPVAYASYGCQCGVCGPNLGPVWDQERDISGVYRWATPWCTGVQNHMNLNQRIRALEARYG